MPGRAFLTDTVISEKMLSEVLSPGMGKRKAVAQQRLSGVTTKIIFAISISLNRAEKR